MTKEHQLKVIRNFSDPLTAQFLRAFLEEHGIPAILKDLNFNFPSALFSSKTAGIKLLVMEKDVDRALLLLNSNNDMPDNKTTDSDDDQ
jgi:hypothetical protein